MKVLIAGASGLLGKKLMNVLAIEHEVGGTYNKKKSENSVHLDITNKNNLEALIDSYKPDVLINCSAIANADYCENNHEDAWKVNVEGTRNLVMVCKSRNIKLVHISSDYVFSGLSGPYAIDSKPEPVNYYGITKLESERIITEELFNFVIIRPTILYGYNDSEDKETFPAYVKRVLSHGSQIELDDDIKKYPLLIDDVAELIRKVLKRDVNGILHIGGKGKVTRYTWALKVAQVEGADDPIKFLKPSVSKNHPATKPYDVELLDDRVERDLGVEVAGLEEGLEIARKQERCFFKLIYSIRPDKLVLGQSASQFRISAGAEIAKEAGVEADIVVPVPESGIFPASGYAMESGIPLIHGLIRDYHTKRTLFESMYETRVNALKRKLVPVPDVIRNKRLVLVDEAIISGSTLKIVVQKLKAGRVKEIHIRIPSPLMLYTCPARMMPRNIELLTHNLSLSDGQFADKKKIENRMREYFDVDTVGYLSLEGLLNTIKRKNWCFYCLKGE